MYIHVPGAYQQYVENVFYASFPTTDIALSDTKMSILASPRASWLKISDDAIVQDQSEFSRWGSYVDPFKDVISLFHSIPEDAEFTVTYESLFVKSAGFWEKFVAFVTSLFAKKAADGDAKDKPKDAKQEKQISVWISFEVSGMPAGSAEQATKDITHVFSKFLQSGSVKHQKQKAMRNMTVGQYVNFFHLPTKANANKSLHYTEYRKLPYPMNLPTRENSPQNEVTLIGSTDYRWKAMRFGIRREDKFRHIYIVGKTGMGKSTFISNMVRSDMITNNGLGVIDPHGDLIDEVMAHIPSRRTNDVVIFDVGDTSFPVGFNILEYETEEEKNLVASGVVSVFKKLYGNSRWPRLEYILRNVMLSVLEYPNATLMHVARMLTDKNFREEVMRSVKDPVILKFWRDEFEKWSDTQRNEAIGPITNKIGQFFSSTIMRNIFAQPESNLKLRKIMDEGKILLVNLSKGKIGDDNASMVGSFLVTKFQIDAMSRANIAYKDRRDFYLYVDEFQNFATDSFADILSEARKYRLSLIVANQYTSQIQENVRDAIFGNVGTIVSFGLGYDDAKIMSSQFKEMIEPNDLLSLPKFRAYIKLMVDGVTTDPFTMATFRLPEPEMSEDIKDKIRKQSRQRYGVEREKLENLRRLRSEKQFTSSEKVVEKAAAEAYKPDGSKFSPEDIKVGEWYEGLVKLQYNYGIFVTVRWVEWLLHKSEVKMPENKTVDRKDMYVSGDKIRVKAKEFKVIDGVKRVVWSQLGE